MKPLVVTLRSVLAIDGSCYNRRVKSVSVASFLSSAVMAGLLAWPVSGAAHSETVVGVQLGASGSLSVTPARCSES